MPVRNSIELVLSCQLVSRYWNVKWLNECSVMYIPIHVLGRYLVYFVTAEHKDCISRNNPTALGNEKSHTCNQLLVLKPIPPYMRGGLGDATNDKLPCSFDSLFDSYFITLALTCFSILSESRLTCCIGCLPPGSAVCSTAITNISLNAGCSRRHCLAPPQENIVCPYSERSPLKHAASPC